MVLVIHSSEDELFLLKKVYPRYSQSLNNVGAAIAEETVFQLFLDDNVMTR